MDQAYRIMQLNDLELLKIHRQKEVTTMSRLFTPSAQLLALRGYKIKRADWSNWDGDPDFHLAVRCVARVNGLESEAPGASHPGLGDLAKWLEIPDWISRSQHLRQSQEPRYHQLVTFHDVTHAVVAVVVDGWLTTSVNMSCLGESDLPGWKFLVGRAEHSRLSEIDFLVSEAPKREGWRAMDPLVVVWSPSIDDVATKDEIIAFLDKLDQATRTWNDQTRPTRNITLILVNRYFTDMPFEKIITEQS